MESIKGANQDTESCSDCIIYFEPTQINNSSGAQSYYKTTRAVKTIKCFTVEQNCCIKKKTCSEYFVSSFLLSNICLIDFDLGFSEVFIFQTTF